MRDFIFIFFEMSKNIQTDLNIQDFKLIIREDGSGIIKDLNDEILFDFDTLSELISKFEHK